MNNEYEKLLKIISEIIKKDGAWTDKRDAIMSEASDDEKTDLAEFCAWFE